MNELHDPFEPIDLFEAFRNGQPEAFRHFFRQHNYQIYIYLLRQTRDRGRSRELTKYCFLVLFRNYKTIKDEAQMLRILYVLARLSLLLQLVEADAVQVLESAWKTRGQDDSEIMDDPAVIGNETLLAIQRALQKILPRQTRVSRTLLLPGDVNKGNRSVPWRRGGRHSGTTI
jgi:DNA-directed RNA polymerase specialized sigma24 family protein